MNQVLSVILGGGAGTRLYPLTRERAKPAVPVGGKYRLIDIPISNCINSDLNHIFVLTQYLSASLNRHISWTYNNLGIFSRGWVQILAAEQGLGQVRTQGWYEGTADAVRKQMFEIEQTGADEIVILSGDHLYRMNYQDFIGCHRESGFDVCIAVQPVMRSQANRLGIMVTDKQGQIVRFAEKPSEPEVLDSLKSWDDPQRPYLASMGIYVFNRTILRELLDEVQGSDFGKHIIPAAIERCKVGTYVFEGFWADIGTIRSFFEVNLMLAHPGAPFRFFEEQSPIFTHPRFLPPSRVEECDLTHVLISEGCQLCEATVRESVVGVRSVIGCQTRISRTLMMGADYYDTPDLVAPNGQQHTIPIGIGEGSEIEGAIIDKNVRIGKGVRIRAHDPDESYAYPSNAAQGKEMYVVQDGIVVIPKNTEIPDGTEI